jgi:cytochrome b
MSERRLVWDLPLRLFHWLLLLCITGLYLTGHADADWLQWLTGRFDVTWMEWHFRFGYTVIGLLLFRILWGFVGPKHARFAQFLPSPATLIAYVKTIAQRDSKPSIGHNPVGALMVLVLLVVVGVQAGSGLFTSDDIVWAGPFFPAVSAAFSTAAGSLHHSNFKLLQWLIVAHVAAIVFYAVWKRQRLVPPMVHGLKSADLVPADEAIKSSRLPLALVLAVATVIVIWWVLQQAPPPVDASY